MSAYREFTGKTVEEALRDAREAFGVGLDDLDFEILSSGSRGVLGMGAEPARVLAAPRSELGGAAPKREAAAAQPLPPPPPREDRERGRFGDRDRDRGRDRGGFGDRGRGRFGDRDRDRGRDRGPDRPPSEGAVPAGDRPPRRDEPDGGRSRDRGPRRDDRNRGVPTDLSASEAAEVVAARGSLAAERADLEAAEASPEALDAGREILEELMRHLGFAVRVDVETGDTSRLNVVGDGAERDALGALIGRKGERLSALQHLVNLMLSKRMGGWTRVLVDVEDYRGRRERQLRELATRAAARVVETGKMLQLEAMPALERRWIHLALRENPDVATQSIGEEPNRRIVVLPRDG
ncbi:MAG TPA: RNA-binding cell elongation regulator Jag/EloR [Candidatus Limnocylindrales bacterium]|jgi:spoIIIJ-associated protein